ncbi:ATP-dependent zinc metalloprotease FtsH [Sulfurovum sp. XTW-4]|uniref:ATP-dependent zinc metalloprotease FtsH n=1 Tax=Sulfurovum xiamenensis TaxID=3019066 RepID=A0ABT7QQI5_9BACT|nr:ATP-dependent zinc metalloprotease FtsH [Sulfurovum xiamenensis]MDM5263346.1 ATP-dependent zinc metalloprotease FtsH [Sulfurovum xiamenensis]
MKQEPIDMPKFNPFTNIWVILIMIMLGFQLYNYMSLQKQSQTLSYDEFKKKIAENSIKEIRIDGDQVVATLKGEIGSRPAYVRTTLPPFEDKTLLALLEKNQVEMFVKSQKESGFWLAFFMLLPLFIFIGFIFYSSRRMKEQLGGMGGGVFDFMKSTAKKYEKQKVSVTFDDLAGVENAKIELYEVVDFLKNPEKYERIGAKIPRGILLMGAPGTGKTLLAKAVAGEAEVPFFSISGSEFVEMFVGVGASRVRDLFNKAKKEAPAIIFIDEIDSVGRARGAGVGGGHDEKEQTLNQILAEMDGFESEEQVVVIAATNRPDVLDYALLRPGRFDRKITLSLPDVKAREKILNIHIRNVQIDNSIDLEKIAKISIGFSGADLANLVNEAAMHAAREGQKYVTQDDFMYARDRIIMGVEQEFVLDEKDKQRVAIHESGHVLAALLLEHADPIEKVSIIPRGQALGMTEQLPLKDLKNFPKAYLLDKIGVMLGGRAAEQTLLGDLSSGAANDLKEATSLATHMVSQWGMSEVLGPVYYQKGEDHVFLGREMAMPKDFSEATAKLIDDEVRKIITEKEEEVLKLFQTHKKEISALSDKLVEKELLYLDEIKSIVDI